MVLSVKLSPAIFKDKRLGAMIVLCGLISVAVALATTTIVTHAAEEGGSHTAGESGHSGGGGSHNSGEGGHSEGGGGGGGHSGGGHSGGGSEAPQHGSKPDHSGHASGVHEGNLDGQDHGSGTRASGRGKGFVTNRLFGGGTGVLGSSQVPEGLSAQTPSEKLGPNARSRLRYWGGRSIPTPEAEEIVPGGGGGTATDLAPLDEVRCGDLSTGPLEPLSSVNLERLRVAYTAVLTREPPGVSEDEQQRAIIQLAVYQFEVLSRPKDFSLAGAFLGAVATVPITEQLVDHVNRTLCVDPSSVRSSSISSIAESERSKRIALGTLRR